MLIDSEGACSDGIIRPASQHPHSVYQPIDKEGIRQILDCVTSGTLDPDQAMVKLADGIKGMECPRPESLKRQALEMELLFQTFIMSGKVSNNFLIERLDFVLNS